MRGIPTVLVIWPKLPWLKSEFGSGEIRVVGHIESLDADLELSRFP